MAEPLQIDDDVPLPPPAHNVRASPVMEAARSMKVGQSITIPYTRTIPWASNMHRATGFKFTQRKEGDKLRIWRIE